MKVTVQAHDRCSKVKECSWKVADDGIRAYPGGGVEGGSQHWEGTGAQTLRGMEDS